MEAWKREGTWDVGKREKRVVCLRDKCVNLGWLKGEAWETARAFRF